MGRIARGWELTKKSWSVVRTHRSLLVFAVIAVLSAVACAVVFFGLGAGIIALTNADWTAIPLFIAGLYVLVVISVFCGVALSACAVQALNGEPTTVADGLAAARARLRLILKWSAVQLLVGGLISLLQAALRQGAGALIGAIIGGLANFAWTVATFFVIPSIAFEGLGPKDAIKRSTFLIRQRWGEGLVGSAAIGIIAFLVGFLPGAIVIGLGAAATNASVVAGIALITVGVAIVAVTALLQTTIVTVFRVALFQFAASGAVLQPFTPDELSHAFMPRRTGVA